jgi:hypothetical protein
MRPIWLGWAAAGFSLAFIVAANAADLSGPVPDGIAARVHEVPSAAGPQCFTHSVGTQRDFWHPGQHASDRWPPDGRKNDFDAITTQFLVQGGVLICGEMPDWPSASGPEEMRGGTALQ